MVGEKINWSRVQGREKGRENKERKNGKGGGGSCLREKKGERITGEERKGERIAGEER